MQKPPVIALDLSAGEPLKLRIGNATCDVLMSSSLSFESSREAIENYGQDNPDARDVVIAFVRSRILRSSPSFTVTNENYRLILERIVRGTGVEIDPSRSDVEIATLLARLLRKEDAQLAESIRAASQSLSKAVSSSVDFSELKAASFLPAISDAAGHSMRSRFEPVRLTGLSSLVARTNSLSRAFSQPSILEAFRSRGFSSAFESIRVSVSELAKRSAESFDLLLPRNWRGRSSSEVSAIVEMMELDSVSLAWIVSEATIDELVGTESQDDRRQILLRDSRQILDEAFAVLDVIEDPRLGNYSSAVVEAIRCFEDGYTGPALRQLMAVETDLLERALGFDKLFQARDYFSSTNPATDVAMKRYSLAAIGRVAAQSLRKFDIDHPTFDHLAETNRHLALHRIGEHDNDLNVISAVLLVVGLICELDRSHNRALLMVPDTADLAA